MKKVIVKKIDNYNYTLVDTKNSLYIKNIEFYSNYKPVVGDVIYLDDKILNENNLYAFSEIFDQENVLMEDMIKIIHDDKVYYFQRIYG